MMLYDRPPRPDDDPPPAAPAVMQVCADPKLPELTLLECPDCVGYGYTGDEHTGCGCDTCDRTGQVEVCSRCLERPWITAGVEACGCTFGPADEPTLEPIVPCECCPRQVPLSELREGLCLDCRRSGLELVIAEDDPNYARWLEYEMAFAQAAGWL